MNKVFYLFTKVICVVGICLISTLVPAHAKGDAATDKFKFELLFTPNLGQVADMAGAPRPDILFTAHSASTNVYLTATGIAYQFSKTKYPEGYDPLVSDINNNGVQTETQTFLLTVQLIGANPHAMVRKEMIAGRKDNFYLSNCPDGITNVSTYRKLVYENVYPNIDWVIYSKGNSLKYDFVVRPGGNTDQIKLAIKDADDVEISANGELLMHTRLGAIKEQAPVSFADGQPITTRFHKNTDGTIGFIIAAFEKKATLTIDPAVTWSTYYGNSALDLFNSTRVDLSGNVYVSGLSASVAGIATTGGFQTTFGGGTGDAVLAKFDALGNPLWVTYYGGAGQETAGSCAVDMSGNIFLACLTNSASGMSTPGAYQTALSGTASDACLVKFSSSGTRLWATYFGGSGAEYLWGCASDATGNVYISGTTNSTTGVATTGAYQTILNGLTDAYVAKFSPSGSILWATYYGGAGTETGNYGNMCSVDASDKLYITFYTTSTTGISTAGAHQTAFGGGTSDACLIKFDPAGVPLWGTYFGGGGNEAGGYSCTTDSRRNVYLAGITTSTTGIATPGAFQISNGGGTDGFIAKFDSAGNIAWSTYYGGSGTDGVAGCTIDNYTANIYVAGNSQSAANVATPDGFQTALTGTSDAFIAKFDSTGARQWGSYFGGNATETAFGCAYDGSGSVYMSGFTQSSTGVATTGAFQTAFGGSSDAFLVKISDLSITTDTFAITTFCQGDTIDVPFTAAGTFHAGNIFTAELSDASGSFALPVAIGSLTGVVSDTISAVIPVGTLPGGNYRIRVTGSIPNVTGTNNGIDLTINPLPVPGVISGATSVCAGTTVTLSAGTPGGTWVSSALSIATVNSGGQVTGVLAGMTLISYTITNSCGTISDTAVLTVNPAPFAGGITGTTTFCMGTGGALADTVAGGAWISLLTAIATINSSGMVTPVSAGANTILYIVTNGCGADTASVAIVVNALPGAGAITGTTNVCIGATSALTATPAGGIWMNTTPAIATINSTGVVTGVATGVDTILYVVTNTCGTDTSSALMTIISTPSAGSITGSGFVCSGSTASLAASVTGGSWSSSAPGTVSVNSSGVITGGLSAGGAAIISYTVTNACGTAVDTMAVTVTGIGSVAPITGTAAVCAGATTLLFDVTTGGVWSSVSTAIATVNALGIVTGVSGGTTTISYTITNSCGSVAATRTVTVGPAPAAGIISGSSIVCVGAHLTLSESVTGGVWSSYAPLVATVSSGGVVLGITTGSTIISYTVTNSCGTASAITVVAVSPAPNAGTISGPSVVCDGSAITLTSSVLSGAWTSSPSATLIISSGGLATGLSPGIATVYYSVTNSCGTATDSVSINVMAPAIADSVTVPAGVCIGSTIMLGSSSFPGTWSSDTTYASVTTGGALTGLASGIATVTYTITNACNTDTAIRQITVYTPAICDSIVAVNNVGTNQPAIALYPNPTTGLFIVSLPEMNEPATLMVTDMYGRTVLKQTAGSNADRNIRIDLSDYAASTYFVTITSAKTTLREKLVKR
ncbi:hypothetical protein CJD36_011125 [Flavipsychrobacter stenotrophus]|uniref:Uncharacterized protein n=1 Tax=Flavipsychrobacter stenotrophus TaxID=2077091 RepID=A0A2S7SUC7_9BACT|nr:T9SS type A sorting domain-containing protein [Flavipsychrobacter stenotrophus]PQJ10520.1 hypothetical protein CJD36_011125 [Flavipsychrobacter stenotrophus]